MSKDYCPIHDKVFLEGGQCPGCDPAALNGVRPVGNAYCGVHDRVYPENSACPGCGPVLPSAADLDAIAADQKAANQTNRPDVKAFLETPILKAD